MGFAVLEAVRVLRDACEEVLALVGVAECAGVLFDVPMDLDVGTADSVPVGLPIDN